MATTDPAPHPRRRPSAATLVVVGCALVAAAARVPGLGWSVGPDESGFTLVARTWHPSAASPYGQYWVDRPPPLIALVRLADAVGGLHALRWLATLGSALLVLAAAALAREVARTGSESTAERAVVLTAIGTTALVSNASIDLVYAKGEVLSLPLLVGSAWLVLRALRFRGALAAALAGLLAGSAIGLKQNLFGGLVFAAVVLVGETVRRALAPRDLARLGGAFLAAALVPALATAAWALGAGVRLSSLWYAVYGFRGDALSVILAGPLSAPVHRAEHLLTVAVTTGLVVLLGWFLLSVRRLARQRPVLTLATLAVLVVDSASLALGGSYWRPYLFGLVPAAVLSLALLASATAATTTVPARPADSDAASTPGGRGPGRTASRRVTGGVVAVLVASCVVSGVQWVRSWPSLSRPVAAVVVGRAIHAASRGGDTLTVWGGQPDVQLASGLSSPYAYLWSLPARTRDPGSRQLAAVLAGPRAPTWFLAWSTLGAWHDGTPSAVGPVLRQRYVRAGHACGGHSLYRLRDAVRTAPAVGCTAMAAARATTGP